MINPVFFAINCD